MKVTITTPKPLPVVTIEMSESEAQSLRLICGHIGGASATSRRGHFDSFAGLLQEVGIHIPLNNENGADPNISIYFEDVDESCL